MTDNDDTQEYLKRIQKTIDQSRNLIAQAREKIAETDKFYAEHGWTREEVKQFLDSPNLPPELRQKLDAAENEWQTQLKDLEQEQQLKNEAERSPEERQAYRNDKFNMMKHTYRL